MYIWPEEWMVKTYQTLKWNLLTALTLLVMVVLYSRIVYTLWFKRDDDVQLTRQQIVCTKVKDVIFIMSRSWDRKKYLRPRWESNL